MQKEGGRVRAVDQQFHQTDIALAVAVIGVVLLLVLPLPAFLLDLLICLNIVFSIIVLLLTLYVERALEFNAFPAALLFLTLYRLGLNIAATRMILTQGEAGDIIHAFGKFMIAGHVGVGLILFALLTTINFMVVTKGAGRVAEVAARFTLEALPGKQMTIDGEVTAGFLSHEAAKRQHQLIQQEAEFYGAMDGASKFVRGDAIATLIMICVNIVGGLVVGLCIKGLSLATCWSLFTRLTVGEGLVSQMPALLISTAAAIMVTRCSAQSLSQALSHQLFHHPKVLTITGCVLLVLGMMPGMPLIVMGPMAAMLLLYATACQRAQQADSRWPSVHVMVGKQLAMQKSTFKQAMTEQVQQRLQHLGLPRLGVRLTASTTLSPDEIEVHVEDTIVGTAHVESAHAAHYVANLITKRGHEILSRSLVEHLIEQLRSTDPELVAELIPHRLKNHHVMHILHHLLREEIPITPLRSIMEALIEIIGSKTDKIPSVEILTERVRERLGRRITHHIFQRAEPAYAITVDPKVEQMIETTLAQQIDTGGHRLRPHVIEKMTQQLTLLQQQGRQRGGRAIVLTDSAVRLRLRQMIEQRLPDLPVLAYGEIAHDLHLETIGMITKEALLP